MTITRVFEDVGQELYYLYVSNDKFGDLFGVDFAGKVGKNRDGLLELRNLLSGMREHDVSLDEVIESIDKFTVRRDYPSGIRKFSDGQIRDAVMFAKKVREDVR